MIIRPSLRRIAAGRLALALCLALFAVVLASAPGVASAAATPDAPIAEPDRAVADRPIADDDPGLAALSARLRQEIPGASIKVVDLVWGVLLEGEVPSPEAAEQAKRIAGESLIPFVAHLDVRPAQIILQATLVELPPAALAAARSPFDAGSADALAGLTSRGEAPLVASGAQLVRSGGTVSIRLDAMDDAGAVRDGAVKLSAAVLAGGAIRVSAHWVETSAQGDDVQRGAGFSADLASGGSVLLTGIPSAQEEHPPTRLEAFRKRIGLDRAPVRPSKPLALLVRASLPDLAPTAEGRRWPASSDITVGDLKAKPAAPAAAQAGADASDHGPSPGPSRVARLRRQIAHVTGWSVARTESAWRFVKTRLA